MSRNTRILVIDDDKNFIEQVRPVLERAGRVVVGYSEGDFYKLFRPYQFDLVLLDLRLQEEKEGLELLRYALEEDPSVPVIVITAYGSVDTAIEALQAGARTYIQKNKITDTELLAIVERFIQEKKAQEKIEALLKEKEKISFVGEDPKIKEALRLAQTAAEDGETSVLIRGETGTGKELVARFIHQTGRRKEGPFVNVAISALNKETLASELFGHERGAFTGATQRHIGYFEQAHRGVLFLDEIGELDPDVQKKLLRVLETHTIRRLGGTRDIELDFQLVTATNAPLEKMVEKGLFRRDLYYRLKVLEIKLPPLRERKSDILLLAEYFLKQLQEKGRTEAQSFSEEAKQIFLNYFWPGNVRELKHTVEYAALRARLSRSSVITRAHLPTDFKTNSKYFEIQERQDIKKILAETELHYIQEALEKCSWKKTEAWKLLGYPNRFTMLRRVKRIFADYPELKLNFPEVAKMYGL